LLPPHLNPTLFPYTTLFRSEAFDYPYRQIADILRVTEANVRQLIITRARKHVRSERHAECKRAKATSHGVHQRRSGRKWEMSSRSEEHTSELQSRGHLVCRL